MVDINNPIEQLKVEQALRSELMKLDYRKKYKPDDVNILDYTVIAALQKQIPKKPTREASVLKCYTCPNCKNVIDEFEKFGETKMRIKNNFCKFCGQKLDWSENIERD